MKFDDSKEIFLVSNNQNLENRWSIVNPDIIQNKTGLNRNLFKEVRSDKLNRTSLNLGYDNKLKRVVTIKTVNYLYGDSSDIEIIKKRRESLKNQLEVLNDISSPLLPEPLDWFEVENNIDNFPDIELNKNEPVLILEHQPGISLRKKLLSRQEVENRSDKVRLDEVNRIATNILYFMMALEEKEYVHLGLCPDNIIMLKDENIRVIGLSKIYRAKDLKININDIKSSKVYGYSAPELYSEENITLDSKALLSFSLGVIIHQLVCCQATIHDYMVEKTNNERALVFSYPNDKSEKYIKNLVRGEAIHKLICDLCNPDPKKRLTDYDKIEQTLSYIGGGDIKTPERSWKKILRNRMGKIVSISQTRPEMTIRDNDNFEEYTMYLRELRYGLNKADLDIDTIVEYDISQNQKGRKKAVNIRKIQNSYCEEDLDMPLESLNTNEINLDLKSILFEENEMKEKYPDLSSILFEENEMEEKNNAQEEKNLFDRIFKWIK